MDRSHEFGLITYWEDHYTDRKKGEAKWSGCESFEEEEEEEKIYLYFNEIFPFFLILAVGFSIAFLALFGEIFYHDFLSQLSKEYFERKFGWMRKTKKQKVKVRRIKVKSCKSQSSKI